MTTSEQIFTNIIGCNLTEKRGLIGRKAHTVQPDSLMTFDERTTAGYVHVNILVKELTELLYVPTSSKCFPL